MAIFNSYVCLPEGESHLLLNPIVAHLLLNPIQLLLRDAKSMDMYIYIYIYTPVWSQDLQEKAKTHQNQVKFFVNSQEKDTVYMDTHSTLWAQSVPRFQVSPHLKPTSERELGMIQNHPKPSMVVGNIAQASAPRFFTSKNVGTKTESSGSLKIGNRIHGAAIYGNIYH